MLLVASLPLAASFIALFNPPEGMSDFGGFLWLMVFGILVRTSVAGTGISSGNWIRRAARSTVERRQAGGLRA